MANDAVIKMGSGDEFAPQSERDLLRDERDALRDELDSAYAELDLIREAIDVSAEPHQNIGERTVETVRAIVAEQGRIASALAASEAERTKLGALLRRARVALQRHLDRHAPMSVPVLDTDSDVVAADIDAALAEREPKP